MEKVGTIINKWDLMKLKGYVLQMKLLIYWTDSQQAKNDISSSYEFKRVLVSWIYKELKNWNTKKTDHQIKSGTGTDWVPQKKYNG